VTANNQSVATGQQVNLSSLFNISGSGITQYKVWFSYPEGGSPALGSLTNNGTPIAADQWVTLNSLNGWVYTGGASSGTDKIWLQAYNGQWNESVITVTDSGMGSSQPQSSAAVSSAIDSEQPGLDQAVSLFSQYMAAGKGQSDLASSSTMISSGTHISNSGTMLARPALEPSHQT
jgi:hypothetical protein